MGGACCIGEFCVGVVVVVGIRTWSICDDYFSSSHMRMGRTIADVAVLCACVSPVSRRLPYACALIACCRCGLDLRWAGVGEDAVLAARAVVVSFCVCCFWYLWVVYM